MKKSTLTGWILSLLVLLFMYTGFSKFFAFDNFTGTMYNQPIPHRLAFFLAWLVPFAEIATACCLLFAKTQRAGLYASFLLLTSFTLYIVAILLHFFRKIPCSCGGIFHWLSWQQHLGVNLLLLALNGLALLPATKQQISSPLNLLL